MWRVCDDWVFCYGATSYALSDPLLNRHISSISSIFGLVIEALDEVIRSLAYHVMWQWSLEVSCEGFWVCPGSWPPRTGQNRAILSKNRCFWHKIGCGAQTIKVGTKWIPPLCSLMHLTSENINIRIGQRCFSGFKHLVSLLLILDDFWALGRP